MRLRAAKPERGPYWGETKDDGGGDGGGDGFETRPVLRMWPNVLVDSWKEHEDGPRTLGCAYLGKYSYGLDWMSDIRIRDGKLP